LNGVGLARDCSSRTGGEQAGPINPITGLRARPGGLYAAVLNGVGANGRAGQGLLGNTALGQAINNGGGLFATAEDSGNFQSTSAAQASVPGWAVAVIVIGSILLVALIVVSVQLTLLIRNS
jgi:hypothetical protein